MVSREHAEKFFTDVVLKSAGIPDKPTYNLREVAKILGYTTAVGLAKARKSGYLELDVVKFSKNSGGGCRVYRESLIRLLQKSLKKEAIHIDEPDGSKKNVNLGGN